jgi:hypothetical protein
MFHAFQIYVAYGCYKSRSGVAYVAMAMHVCCKYMFQVFQLFQTYVASVSSGCCICCSGYTCMLQVCFPNISTVLPRCCMLSSEYCICCSDYTRMLQMYVLNISPISDVCCKFFYLDAAYVAVVIYICCKMYVLIVLPGFSMLQQVMFPARSDSRARTRCTYPSNAAYLYHAD